MHDGTREHRDVVSVIVRARDMLTGRMCGAAWGLLRAFAGKIVRAGDPDPSASVHGIGDAGHHRS